MERSASFDDREPAERPWHGALADPDALGKDAVQHGHALADAARDGTWQALAAELDTQSPWDVNAWRPAGTARYTPLHQAAWHGAPGEVIADLIARGAWLTQRTAEGQTAQEVAESRGHHAAAALLAPRPLRTLDFAKSLMLDKHLAALIESRIRPHLTVRLTPPQAIVLTEMREQDRLWFAIPGMYGGFAIQLLRGYLYTESWSRVVGGSGQAHVVTTNGYTLVDQGFV